MATIDGKTFRNIPLMGVTGGDTYTNCVFKNVGFTGSLTLGPGCSLRNIGGDLETLTMTGSSCKLDNVSARTGSLSVNEASLSQTSIATRRGAVGSLAFDSAGMPTDSRKSRLMYRPGQVSIEDASGAPLLLGYPSKIYSPSPLVTYGSSVKLSVLNNNGGVMPTSGVTITSGATGVVHVGHTGGEVWATYVSDGAATLTGFYEGSTGVYTTTLSARSLLAVTLPQFLPLGSTGEVTVVCAGRVPWGSLIFGSTGAGPSFSVLAAGGTGTGLTGGTYEVRRSFSVGASGSGSISASCTLGATKVTSNAAGVTGFMPGYAVFEVKVAAGQSVTLQSIKTGVTTRVLWGDGTVVSGSTSSFSKTYVEAGTYLIQTDAASSGTGNQHFPNNSYLIKVHRWGNLLKGVWNGDRLLLGSTALVSLPPTWEGLESVGSLYYAFRGCASLCVLPSSWVGLSSLTSAFGAFESSGITDLPSSWRGLENVTTTRAMFYNCTQLLSAPSSWEGLEKNTNTWDMFYNNVRLQTPITSWAGLGRVDTAINMFYGTAIPSIPTSWAGLGSLVNASEMFRNCSSLVTGGTADIGTLSKVTNCYMMMDGCSSYKGNVLNLYNTLRNRCTSTNYYRYAFRGCSSAVGYADLSYYWKN